MGLPVVPSTFLPLKCTQEIVYRITRCYQLRRNRIYRGTWSRTRDRSGLWYNRIFRLRHSFGIGWMMERRQLCLVHGRVFYRRLDNNNVCPRAPYDTGSANTDFPGTEYGFTLHPRYSKRYLKSTSQIEMIQLPAP